jgi:hypothetical protein
MTETANVPRKVTELETRIKQLEIATLVILNLLMVVYLLAR